MTWPNSQVKANWLEESHPGKKTLEWIQTEVFSSTLVCFRFYLKRFVEKETEVGEYHPELLPSITVFELAQQVPAELILNWKPVRANGPRRESIQIVAGQTSSAKRWSRVLIDVFLCQQTWTVVFDRCCCVLSFPLAPAFDSSAAPVLSSTSSEEPLRNWKRYSTRGKK